MKMTIVTDDRGQLVGAMHGITPRPDPSKAPGKGKEELRGGLMAGPGQRVHEVDVPAIFGVFTDPYEFGEALMKHVLKEGLLG